MKTIQQNIIELKTPDKGWLVKRTAYNPREKAFAQTWADVCKPVSFLNYGYGCVQDLFMRLGSDPALSRHNGAVAVLTKRERMIVATVIQWLGSNVGFEFLSSALRKCGYKIIKIED